MSRLFSPTAAGSAHDNVSHEYSSQDSRHPTASFLIGLEPSLANRLDLNTCLVAGLEPSKSDPLTETVANRVVLGMHQPIQPQQEHLTTTEQHDTSTCTDHDQIVSSVQDWNAQDGHGIGSQADGYQESHKLPVENGFRNDAQSFTATPSGKHEVVDSWAPTNEFQGEFDQDDFFSSLSATTIDRHQSPCLPKYDQQEKEVGLVDEVHKPLDCWSGDAPDNPADDDFFLQPQNPSSTEQAVSRSDLQPIARQQSATEKITEATSAFPVDRQKQIGQVVTSAPPPESQTTQSGQAHKSLEDLWGSAFDQEDILLEYRSDQPAMVQAEDVAAVGGHVAVDQVVNDEKKVHAADEFSGKSAEISWDDAFADDDDDFLSSFTPVEDTTVVPQTQSAKDSSKSYLPSRLQISTSASRSNQWNAPPTVPLPGAPVQNAPVCTVKLTGKYNSPYDLPEDFVKPAPKKKSLIAKGRPGPSVMPTSAPSVLQPPVRSSSLPPIAQRAAPPPPISDVQASASQKAKNTFFQDLPVVPPRQRAATPSGRYTPQLQDQPRLMPPPIARQPSPSSPSQTLAQPDPAATQKYLSRPVPPRPYRNLSSPVTAASLSPSPPLTTIPSVPSDLPSQLLHPTKLAPYGDHQSSSQYTTVSHSVPVPALVSASMPDAATAPFPAPVPARAPTASRYSPAPSTQKPSVNRYVSDPGQTRTQLQQYAPRTSSPLTCATLNTDTKLSSNPAELSNLPQQRDQTYVRQLSGLSQSSLATVQENQVADLKSSQSVAGQKFAPSRQRTPPPFAKSEASSATSSPRKWASQAAAIPPLDTNFVPPKRSQTSSPSVAAFKSTRVPMTAIDRPASAQGALSPTSMHPNIQPTVPLDLGRLPSQSQVQQEFQLIPPQDDRINDPLQRWRGYPIFAWAGTGTIITAFPSYLPRYVQGQASPRMHVGGGEFRIRNASSLAIPLDHVAKFPGPLKKGKKKEVLAWLKFGVERIQLYAQTAPHSTHPHHQTRLQERILLWRILSLLVEHDGVLDATSTVAEAAKMIFADPSLDCLDPAEPCARAAPMLPDALDAQAVATLRSHLIQGHGEQAVWHAVDQRLWGPAFLVASTLSKDIWKQVIQEFVRKEVKDKSLAALFQVFAGNWDESIDELVSVSARAGFQMVNTMAGSSADQDALAGLEKWRETVLLILCNRSPGDAQALVAIGRMLASYSRIEAAHICYLFAGSRAVFGGVEDGTTDFSLLGSDAALSGADFCGEMESILLGEVYEYACSLSGTTPTPFPHLQAFKFYHAQVLAENGFRSEAQQYCDAAKAAVYSKTKTSPYYNVVLMQAIDALSKRLSEAPLDPSGSWKPSIGQVSNSLWTKFNTFVAGDDKPDSPTPPNEPSQSPRFSGATPPLSVTPSSTDLYGAYHSRTPSFVATQTNSRYAPKRASEQLTHVRPQSASHSTHRSRLSMDSSKSSQGTQSVSPQRLSSHATSQNIAQQPARPSMQYTAQPLSGYHPNGVLNAQSSFSVSSAFSAPHMYPVYTPSAALDTVPTALTLLPESASSSTFDHQSFSSVKARVDEPSVATSSHNYVQTLVPFASESTYQPPTSSFEPLQSSYEPYRPELEPEPEPELELESEAEPQSGVTQIDNSEKLNHASFEPKKNSFLDDDEDDDLLARAAALKNKSNSANDRATDEVFRKAAEADSARPTAQQNRSWLGGWFGKKSATNLSSAAGSNPNAASGERKVVKANLGEKSSFVFDPDLNKWVNKAATLTSTPPLSATPPPPKALTSTSTPPRSSTPAATSPSNLPGPPSSTSPLPSSGALSVMPSQNQSMNDDHATKPPSRPGKALSNVSDIDDLLGPPSLGPRSKTVKSKRKSRYVDVMADKIS